jgi:hypothetical protein
VAGVSVTVVPCGKEAVHVPPEQDNPDGLLVTLPLPSPMNETLSERDTVGVLDENVAETVAEATKVSTQLLVPEQDPPQPENE